MVRRTQVVIEDDLTGEPAAHTMSFSLDGTAYEIDLTAANADELRRVLQPFIDRRGPPRASLGDCASEQGQPGSVESGGQGHPRVGCGAGTCRSVARSPAGLAARGVPRSEGVRCRRTGINSLRRW
ncbi:MAG: Lsr2 family protein [Actinobacteria bacterium]|nr:Lsr2 family protein [Actinomycetota bacterium]